uniref:Uncharacterized protein n=1 Tax=Haptolina ericina TaxID=156174 RepID=A0A7S3AZD3_9EUKA|mmetsp:Transcript_4368/g.9476  ORF Transcript_4368/g.9476 Transcript_4368/m.9476 type:complete len:107 (+) Transcript_4368:402-722(+)
MVLHDPNLLRKGAWGAGGHAAEGGAISAVNRQYSLLTEQANALLAPLLRVEANTSRCCARALAAKASARARGGRGTECGDECDCQCWRRVKRRGKPPRFSQSSVLI